MSAIGVLQSVRPARLRFFGAKMHTDWLYRRRAAMRASTVQDTYELQYQKRYPTVKTAPIYFHFLQNPPDMVSSKPRHAEDGKVTVANLPAVSPLQLPVIALGPLIGHLHKHLCPCNFSEDNGQKP